MIQSHLCLELSEDKMKKLKIFDQKKISELTRISKKFLFIDKAYDIKPGAHGKSRKKISLSDWFLKSHFKNEPTMPGSLLIEAMLQTVVTIIYSDDKFKFKRSLIVKTQTSFFKKIDKSGIIIIKAKILKKTNNFILAKAEVYFKNQKICDGIFHYINV